MGTTSKAAKDSWANPEIRAKRIAAIKAGKAKNGVNSTPQAPIEIQASQQETTQTS